MLPQHRNNVRVNREELPEYLTNIIYNQNMPQNCQLLLDVPMQAEVNLQQGWQNQDLPRNRDRVRDVQLSSVVCCLVQLFHLLFAKPTEGLNLSRRNIVSMSLLLEDKKKPASQDEYNHFQSFQRGEFQPLEQIVSCKVLKILVRQNQNDDGFMDVNHVRDSVRAPIAVYKRLAKILRAMTEMLLNQRETRVFSSGHFNQFFDMVEHRTLDATLQKLKEELENQAILMRNYSLYTSMKEICFCMKVAKHDMEAPGGWGEISMAGFRSLISETSAIKKVLYSDNRDLAEQRKAVERRGEPHFVLYFKQHPNVENGAILTEIETDHSDIPVEEALSMDPILEFLRKDNFTGIVTRFTSLHEQDVHKESTDLSFNKKFYSSKYLSSTHGQLMNEQTLLQYFSELCMRGVLLRIRLNALLRNELTDEQHRAETIHYFNAIRRKVSRMRFKREHGYVKELQTYP